MSHEPPSSRGPHSVAPASGLGPPSSRRSRKLRVCVIRSTYADQPDDLLVPWLRGSAAGLARRGHQVTVVVPSGERESRRTVDGITVMGFRYAPRVQRVGQDEPSSGQRNPLVDLLAPAYLASGAVQLSLWIAWHRFEVLHLYGLWPHAALASLALTSSLPTAVTCTWAELALARRDGDVARALRRSLVRASALSCRTSQAQKEIERICGRRAEVIPDGVSAPEAAPPRPVARASAAPTLFWSGALRRGAGIDVLLRALTRVMRERSARLVLAGEGECRTEWQALSAMLGLRDSVEFLGAVGADRLAELYRACDLYVSPALSGDADDVEGLHSIVEASLHGCPIVASGVGGIVDVVRHEETGLLVAENSESELAAAVLRMLGDRVLAGRLGEAAREFALAHFESDRVADATETLYHRAMAVARARPGLEQRTRA